ncbi:MAG: hypothetical protein Q8926_11495, partial [Bacteroidota bacterium]|nr:hypothetical protein [Bacteroidota bacterium]
MRRLFFISAARDIYPAVSKPDALSKTLRLACGMILMIIATSFRTTIPPAPNLILRFKITLHGQPLELHKDYPDPFGESFKLDIFRFYTGKISAGLNGAPAEKGISASAYQLIDFADSNSTSVALHIKNGDYNEIRLRLGIDSADQTSGAQTGLLDPLKGMFWTWNSGYICFKIEGVSPESNEPAHGFAYHIGGYRSPYQTIRTIKLATPPGRTFHVNKAETTILVIPIDLDRFFQGITPIHIRNTPACTTPGELAHKLFENF